jgi:coenzyme PQQ precursor peptide PqqA
MPAGSDRRILRRVPNAIGNHSTFWRDNMTWETPNAIDFRFGFEITMYIATR